MKRNGGEKEKSKKPRFKRSEMHVEIINIISNATTLPDLIITEKWVWWPDNCTICYNITNIGDGTAPACHNTTLYVDGVEVAHDHVPVDLAPGESDIGCFDDYTWTYTPPSDNITVCADNSETVDKLDETKSLIKKEYKNLGGDKEK